MFVSHTSSHGILSVCFFSLLRLRILLSLKYSDEEETRSIHYTGVIALSSVSVALLADGWVWVYRFARMAPKGITERVIISFALFTFPRLIKIVELDRYFFVQ